MSAYYSYDDFKYIVNERAKRQILRFCKKFMKHHNFTLDDLLALKGRDEQTIKLYIKYLGGSMENIEFTAPPKRSENIPEILDNSPEKYVQYSLKAFE